MRYFSFSDLLHSVWHRILVHLCFCKWHYFILFKGWVIVHCVSVLHLLYHSSVDGHLGCFHVLTVVNSDAVNIRVRVSFQIMRFSRYMSRSGIAGSYGSSVNACILSHVQLFVTPWIIALQAPLFVGFFRQEYWSVLPVPSSGYLPNPGIEPTSPACKFFTSEPPRKPLIMLVLWD